MFKVMNLIFGIGIALVLFLLAILGTQAFYPEPENAWEKCENASVRYLPEQINLSAEQQQEKQQCYTYQEDLLKDHGYKVFIISSIIATIFIIASYFLLSHIHISAGVASAGIILSFYAFIKGWEASGPKTRFFISLILAAVVIIFAYFTADKIKSKK